MRLQDKYQRLPDAVKFLSPFLTKLMSDSKVSLRKKRSGDLKRKQNLSETSLRN